MIKDSTIVTLQKKEVCAEQNVRVKHLKNLLNFLNICSFFLKFSLHAKLYIFPYDIDKVGIQK